MLLLEPGARPQAGWIEEIAEYAMVAKVPARFSPSRTFRHPLLKRLFRRPGRLEHGYLVPKREATTQAASGQGLIALANGKPVRTLRAEIIPAWVIRDNR